MSNHTPTPWGTHPDTGLVYSETSDQHGEALFVADCEWYKKSDGVAASDAAHMVMCVNAHESLVAALENVTNELARMKGYYQTVSENPSWARSIVKHARAALAKVQS